MAARSLEIRGNLESAYADVFTPEAVAALEALARLDADRKAVMAARLERRGARARNKQRIAFLDPPAAVGAADTAVLMLIKVRGQTADQAGFDQHRVALGSLGGDFGGQGGFRKAEGRVPQSRAPGAPLPMWGRDQQRR